MKKVSSTMKDAPIDVYLDNFADFRKELKQLPNKEF